MEILFLIGRFLYGGYLIKSSWSHFSHNGRLAAYAASKKVPMPRLAVFVAGVCLLLGGLRGIFGNLYPMGGACHNSVLYSGDFYDAPILGRAGCGGAGNQSR